MTVSGMGTPSAPNPTSDRVPPTDSDRIRMFVSLAQEHAEFAALLSASNTVTMAEPATAEEYRDHRRRQLRAASARKFVLQTSDHVHLSNVFDSVQNCVAEGASRMTSYLEGLREKLTEIRDESIFEYHLDNDHPVNDRDLIDDLVYGRLLHADYAKWWRTERRKSTGWEVSSLSLWISSADQLIATTQDMIIRAVKLGHIRLT